MISGEQRVCVDWAVEAEEGDSLRIEAFAGTGKTTTLGYLVAQIKAVYPTDRVLYLAYNSAIAAETATKPAFEGCDVMTCHAFGARAIRAAYPGSKLDKSGEESRKLCQSALVQILGTPRAANLPKSAASTLSRAVSLAKNTLATPKSLPGILDDFDLGAPESIDSTEWVQCVAAVIAATKANLSKFHGFDDMVWAPARGLVPVPTRYQWILVDEAQDLNRARMSLVLRTAGKSARVVYVGDSRQAIYGFQGADESALDTLGGLLSPRGSVTVATLSTTYRCPKSVVTEAQKIVPAFRAADGNLLGEVRGPTKGELPRPGDFVISRLNAPLATWALRLLRARIPARIRGKDTADGLAKILEKCTPFEGASVADVISSLRAWESDQIDKFLAQGEKGEAKIALVRDQVETLLAIGEDCVSVSDWRARLESLYSDDRKGSYVELLSAHKSKGLEAPTVWVLTDTFKTGLGGQEANLYYVAVTRAQSTLVLV